MWTSLTKEARLSVYAGAWLGSGSARGLQDEGKVAETAKWDSSFQEVMGECVKQQLTPAWKVLAAVFIGQHLTMEEKLSRHTK